MVIKTGKKTKTVCFSSIYIRDLNLAPIRFVQFVLRFFPRCPLYSFIISMAPLASSIGTRIFFSKTPRVFAYFSTHWRSLNHFFMYTCRKIIGITLANIILGIHVSLASFLRTVRVVVTIYSCRVANLMLLI